MTYAIGIDLGGTNVKMVAITPTGEILAQSSTLTGEAHLAEWSGRIRDQVAALEGTVGAAAPGIGLAAPGLPARDRRSIGWMPGKVPGLEGFDWTDFLGRAEVVPVLNDAHAALLGEAWLGAARGYHDVLLLTLGTGVGGAILIDGKLHRGVIGRAGHAGHVSLDPNGPPSLLAVPGALELWIGNHTVPARTDGRFRSTAELVKAHQSGDAEATVAWQKSLRALGAAITSLINVLDPEAVILGGGIADAGEALFEPLRGIMDAIEWRPYGTGLPILPASLGSNAGAIGAAKAALP